MADLFGATAQAARRACEIWRSRKGDLRGRARRFFRASGGNVAIFFSLSAPVLMLSIGAAIDYSRMVGARSSLQTLADSAALAGARTLRLASSTQASVQQTVSNFIAAQASSHMAPITATTNLAGGNTIVSVKLSQTVPGVVANLTGFLNMHIAASAQARIVGGMAPVCMVSLDPSQSQALAVDVAKVVATGCQVISNSTASDGMSISNGAQLQTALVCSSGGAKTDTTSSYSPAAQIDCPVAADPLANLPAPAVGGCTYNNLKITSGSQSLSPGVYCGGLSVSGSANVSLLAGTYIIKSGQLSIKSGAGISGSDVSIFLTGGATLKVDNTANISLSAPATGALAGVLIFEDRTAPLHQTHEFSSRNAPNMLGTIYLPNGDLEIGIKGGGGSGGVAVGATSAWTIVLARTISITDNQTLQLNTNYSATPVQPPAGLGPNVPTSQLIQ